MITDQAWFECKVDTQLRWIHLHLIIDRNRAIFRVVVVVVVVAVVR